MHEDEPERVAAVLTTFLDRFCIGQPKRLYLRDHKCH